MRTSYSQPTRESGRESTHAPGMQWHSSDGPLDANVLTSLKSGRVPWPKVQLQLLSRCDRICLPMPLGRA